MSDQSEDLLPEELEADEAPPEEEAEDLAFLDDLESDIPAGFESFVKLRTTSGSPVFVPIDEPVTIANVLEMAQLRPTDGTEFWVGGVEVDYHEFEVGPGAEVVVVGSVKGA